MSSNGSGIATKVRADVVSQNRRAEGPAAQDVSAEPAAAALSAARATALPARIAALQRVVGNHEMSHMLGPSEHDGADTLVIPTTVQRNILGDVLDKVRGGGAKDDKAKAEADLDAFRKKALPCLTNHHPSSGRGNFDVCLTPSNGQMAITLKIKFNFVEGDPTKVPKGFRPDEFKWTPTEQATFKAKFIADVSAVWSRKFTFKSTKKFWDAMTVDTTVSITEGAGAHYIANVGKYPPDSNPNVSAVCPPGTHHGPTGTCDANAADASGKVPDQGDAVLTSTDLLQTDMADSRAGVATTPVKFKEGKSTLDSVGLAGVAPVLKALKDDPKNHVTLIGHASATHKVGENASKGVVSNMDLARARSEAVKTHLTTNGIAADRIMIQNVGEQSATTDTSFCRCDCRVGKRELFTTAPHETGHMLGNADEYAGAGAVLAPTYDAMIKSTTGHTVARADTKGIMSVGSTVEPWNYAAFLEALRKVSGMPEWGM